MYAGSQHSSHRTLMQRQFALYNDKIEQWVLREVPERVSKSKKFNDKIDYTTDMDAAMRFDSAWDAQAWATARKLSIYPLDVEQFRVARNRKLEQYRKAAAATAAATQQGATASGA